MHVRNGPDCTCPNDAFHDHEELHAEYLRETAAKVAAERDIERLRAALQSRDEQLSERAREIAKLHIERERLRAANKRSEDAMTFAVRWVQIFGNTPESGIDHIRRVLDTHKAE